MLCRSGAGYWHNYNKILKASNTDTYMIEMYILTKCNYFIVSQRGGGLWIPILEEDEFKDVYYFDNINVHQTEV